MFLLELSEILGLFVNAFTADDKYSLLRKRRQNLAQPIQILLSKK